MAELEHGPRGEGGDHLDEGTVHAWLDGQLPRDDGARLEAHVAECASCSAMVAEARGFIAASSRILTGLDGVPARVVPAQRPRIRVWQVRAAAAVVVVALGAAAVLRRGGVPEVAKEQKSEVGGRGPEEQRSEVGGRRSEEKSAVGDSHSAVGGPQAAVRGQPSAVSSHQSAVSSPKPPLAVSEEPRSALRKDQTGALSNQLARRESPQMADTRTAAVGGVAGAAGGGGEEKTRAASGLQSLHQERNAPPPSDAAYSAHAAPAPAPAAAPRRLSPAVDSIRLLKPKAPAVADSVAVAAKVASGGVARGAAAAQAPAPASSPAATDAQRADSLFAQSRAATDEGYVPPPPLQRRVTGRVVDSAARTPIGGATIRVAGANVATETDDSGAFSVPVPAGSDTVVALHIGYVARRVPVSALERDTTIALVSSPVSLSQAVATAAAGQSAERRITGHVVDSAQGAPISGATVRVAGTSRTATTDTTGAFTVSAPSGTRTLIVRARGHRRQVVTMSGAQRDTTVAIRPKSDSAR